MASNDRHETLSAQSWPLRTLRAFSASAAGLTLAAGGHRFGGGEMASGPVIAVVFATVFVLAWFLGNRQLTTGQILGLLLIAQIVVHVGCALGGPTSTLGPAMIVGHLLATLLAALVLVRGERFLWMLADRLGLQAVQLLFARVGILGPAPRPRFSRQEKQLPARPVLVGGNGLRGPPVGCA